MVNNHQTICSNIVTNMINNRHQILSNIVKKQALQPLAAQVIDEGEPSRQISDLRLSTQYC
jgi:hypothetical protein